MAQGPLSARQIRQAFAIRVLSAAPGLVESRWGYDGMQEPSRSPVHLSYGVGIPLTEFAGTRQRLPGPVESLTDVRVAIQYQIMAHREVESADEAYDLLQAMRNHLLIIDADWPQGAKPVWQRDERSLLTSGWLFLESIYSVKHYDPLTN